MKTHVKKCSRFIQFGFVFIDFLNNSNDCKCQTSDCCCIHSERCDVYKNILFYIFQVVCVLRGEKHFPFQLATDENRIKTAENWNLSLWPFFHFIHTHTILSDLNFYSIFYQFSLSFFRISATDKVFNNSSTSSRFTQTFSNNSSISIIKAFFNFRYFFSSCYHHQRIYSSEFNHKRVVPTIHKGVFSLPKKWKTHWK